MTLCLPVVCTSVGGIPEVVTDGVHGRLVPAGQPDALARALLDVVADPGARERMGVADAALAVERFDIRRAQRRIEQIYVEALADRR